MTRKVKQSPICCGLTSIAGFTWLLVANMASGQTAEAFYASDVDSIVQAKCCLLYTSPSPRDLSTSRMPSSA